jgi:uncharacterized protein YneF (UPF0154 family)
MGCNAEEHGGCMMNTFKINVLKLFGWIDLFAGVIGGLFILIKYGTKEIVTGPYNNPNIETIINPLGVGSAIAVLVQGVFVWALFSVIAGIAENIVILGENVTKTDLNISKILSGLSAKDIIPPAFESEDNKLVDEYRYVSIKNEKG